MIATVLRRLNKAAPLDLAGFKAPPSGARLFRKLFLPVCNHYILSHANESSFLVLVFENNTLYFALFW